MNKISQLRLVIGVTAFAMGSIALPGCKHDPIDPLTSIPNGGGNGGNGLPCNPDSVYFDQQVLPLLISRCTRDSGCHSANVAENGIILDSYAHVTNTAVDISDPLHGDFWEKITESNSYDRMPPPGEPPLSQSEKNLIGLWLSQGAQNLHCDEGLSGCDSVTATFSGSVQPIINAKCIGCHNTGNAGNMFVSLADYAGIASVAATNQLVGSITHTSPYQFMPKAGPQLSPCEIAKIRSWVILGYQNN